MAISAQCRVEATANWEEQREQALSEWDGSASTKIDALAILSRLLKGAVRAQLIPANPAHLARRPVPEPQLNVRSRALTAAEVPAVLAAVPPGPYRNYWMGGLRKVSASAMTVR